MSDERTLDDRLASWGVYWRWRRSSSQAQSFEGQYRSPQRWDAPVLTLPKSVDPHDANTVEQAVCALNIYHHVLLKCWYIRLDSGAVCVIMGCKAANRIRPAKADFDGDMVAAKLMLSAELERPAVVRKQRASECVRKLLGLEPLTKLSVVEYSPVTI